MNIVFYVKEFFSFIRLINSYQKIELEDSDKIKLEAFDKDLLKKLTHKVNENIIREGLRNNLSLDYIMGYKHAMAHYNSFFKKYFK